MPKKGEKEQKGGNSIDNSLRTDKSRLKYTLKHTQKVLYQPNPTEWGV